MDLDYDELGDYHRECYERYLRDFEEDPEGMRVRQWDVAKYNPYAAYMFASRMENGELAGDAGNYYQKAAELGCSRAVWKVVANPSFMRGVRHTCVMFDRCVNHHSVGNGEDRGSAIREEAERRAETHPILWTLLSYSDLRLGLSEEFEEHSEKAILNGSRFAMYMRASQLLRRARSTEGDEAGRMACEAIELLRGSRFHVWESERLLGEQYWTGRWTEGRTDWAMMLFESAAGRSGRGMDDPWMDYIWNPPKPEKQNDDWEHVADQCEATGLFRCGNITETTEWKILLRVTETDGYGATMYIGHVGILGGFENDTFVLNPFGNRCERPDFPFLVFKPSGVGVYCYDDPRVNARMDVYGMRMMLKACVDSVTGAA